MELETNLSDWEDEQNKRLNMLNMVRRFSERLKGGLLALGTDDELIGFEIEHSWSNNVRVRCYTVPPGVSVLAIAQVLAAAMQIDPPPLKLRFRGAADGNSCEIPYNEWYLQVGTSEQDTNKVRVDLTHNQSGYTRVVNYNVSVYGLPVPGYLHGVRETPEAAMVRQEEETAEAAEKQRLERNARARASRAAAKRRAEQPAIEAPVDQKPMLLGPKGLSLCKDAPEDIETPQLEEAHA